MRASRRRFVLGFAGLATLPALLAACQSAPPTAAPPPTAAAKPAVPPSGNPAPAPTTVPPSGNPAPAAGATPAAGAPAAKATGGLDLGGYNGPAPSSQPIKLRMTRQIFTPEVEAWWKAEYAQWATAYPNVTVQEETVPYGDLNTKLQTYVAAGDMPDIIMGKGDFVQSYVFNKIALNLSDFMSNAFVLDLTPTAKAQLIVAGKLYASAWEQAQVMLYFNKDLFEKAGVATPPEGPDLSKAWTWDQFVEAGKKLTTGLNAGGEIATYAMSASGYGNGGPGSSYWYEGQYIRSMGDPGAAKDSTTYKTFAGVSEDGGTASGYVDTPEAIKGMQLYQSFFQQKFTPTTAVAQMFDDQKAATTFSGVGLALRYATTPPKFKWGAASLPKARILFNHTSGDSPIVWAKTKYPAESAALLAFLTNDAGRISYHKVRGQTPSRVSLFDKVGYDSPEGKLSLELTRIGYAPPVTPGYLEYFNAMNAAVKDIALGAAAEDRLHKVAKDIDGLLATYRK